MFRWFLNTAGLKFAVSSGTLVAKSKGDKDKK